MIVTAGCAAALDRKKANRNSTGQAKCSERRPELGRRRTSFHAFIALESGQDALEHSNLLRTQPALPKAARFTRLICQNILWKTSARRQKPIKKAGAPRTSRAAC